MGTSGKEPKQSGKAFPNKRGPARSCHRPLATTAPDPTEPERVSGAGRRGGRLSPLAAPVEKDHPPHPLLRRGHRQPAPATGTGLPALALGFPDPHPRADPLVSSCRPSSPAACAAPPRALPR